MARTQAIDYDEKRDTITQNAAKLFARKGFVASSVSDLAAACDISKALVYYYFGSKEDILFEVMNDHMEELLRITDEIKNLSKNPTDLFFHFVRALMKHYTGAANSQKVLLLELKQLPAKARAEIVSKQLSLVKFTENLLLATKPDSKETQAEIKVKVMLFFGMINWTHNWYNPDGTIMRESLADIMADMTLKSLA